MSASAEAGTVVVTTSAATPDRVEMVLPVSPPEASLFTSPTRIASQPLVGSFPRDAAAQRVCAEATRYVSQALLVVFDPNRTLDLTLDVALAEPPPGANAKAPSAGGQSTSKSKTTETLGTPAKRAIDGRDPSSD